MKFVGVAGNLKTLLTRAFRKLKKCHSTVICQLKEAMQEIALLVVIPILVAYQ